MHESACIVAHARTEMVKKSIEKLRKFGIRTIYLYIDGPKSELIRVKQNELLRELSLQVQSGLELRVKRRNLNWGASVSVLKALDDFFSKEPFGMILEDDLDFDEGFMQFVRLMRTQFIEDETAWVLAGSNLIEETKTPTYISYPQIWGWATSAEKWQQMRKALLSKQHFSNSQVPLHVQSFWKTGQRRALKGYLDVWDIPLACAMIALRKRTILPPVNLVSNLGNDSYATHTSNVEIFRERQELPLDLDLSVLSEGIVDRDAKFESEVFKIKTKHLLSYPKSLLLDNLNRKSKGSLTQRLKHFEEVEKF